MDPVMVTVMVTVMVMDPTLAVVTVMAPVIDPATALAMDPVMVMAPTLAVAMATVTVTAPAMAPVMGRSPQQRHRHRPQHRQETGFRLDPWDPLSPLRAELCLTLTLARHPLLQHHHRCSSRQHPQNHPVVRSSYDITPVSRRASRQLTDDCRNCENKVDRNTAKRQETQHLRLARIRNRTTTYRLKIQRPKREDCK